MFPLASSCSASPRIRRSGAERVSDPIAGPGLCSGLLGLNAVFFFHILNQLRVLHSLPGLGCLLWGYENWTMTGLVLLSLVLVVRGSEARKLDYLKEMLELLDERGWPHADKAHEERLGHGLHGLGNVSTGLLFI